MYSVQCRPGYATVRGHTPLSRVSVALLSNYQSEAKTGAQACPDPPSSGCTREANRQAVTRPRTTNDDGTRHLEVRSCTNHGRARPGAGSPAVPHSKCPPWSACHVGLLRAAMDDGQAARQSARPCCVASVVCCHSAWDLGVCGAGAGAAGIGRRAGNGGDSGGGLQGWFRQPSVTGN